MFIYLFYRWVNVNIKEEKNNSLEQIPVEQRGINNVAWQRIPTFEQYWKQTHLQLIHVFLRYWFASVNTYYFWNNPKFVKKYFEQLKESYWEEEPKLQHF